MKQLLNHLTESPAWATHGPIGPLARWTGIAVLVGVGSVGCTDATAADPSVPNQGGTGGQVSGGTGGTAVVAGASGKATGGTPSGGGGGTAGAAGGGMATAGTSGSGGAGGSGGTAGSGGAADGWIPLFNGTDLDGWTAHGTSDTLFVVANGEIHVYPTQPDQSDQPQANLLHETKLGGKYTLHVEYKWGETRFGDRKQTDRDAGILFHVTGDLSNVWPDSIECQLGSSQVGGSWVSGDLWVLGGPTVAQVKNESGQFVTIGAEPGCCHPSFTKVHAELAHGEWNTVDIIINGGTEAIYMVNDVEVNRVYNMTYNGQPLTEGNVSIQAEFAELFYRNIRYKVNP